MSQVTIVMGTYNGAEFLRAQLDSLLANSFTDWELLLSDDGSKDETLTIAAQYERKYPGKIFVSADGKNRGTALNFLHAAARTKTPYVMFCDQDDVWLPDKIEDTLRFMKEMERRLGSGMPLCVFTDAVVTDGDLKVLAPSFHQSNHLSPRNHDLPHLLMENKGMGCTMLFNRALADCLTPLPRHARVHDWWVILLAASLGQVGYLPKATLYYRQHGGNVIGSQSFGEYVRERAKSPDEQKRVLLATIAQGEELLRLWGDKMPREKRTVLEAFIRLKKAGFWEKRKILLRYHFFKSGLLRNLGLLVRI